MFTLVRAVLALPGAGDTRSGVLEASVVLARDGFGWFGERDVDAAITFLVTQPEVDPERMQSPRLMTSATLSRNLHSQAIRTHADEWSARVLDHFESTLGNPD